MLTSVLAVGTLCTQADNLRMRLSDSHTDANEMRHHICAVLVPRYTGSWLCMVLNYIMSWLCMDLRPQVHNAAPSHDRPRASLPQFTPCGKLYVGEQRR
jgi:hypothetical protein